MKYIILFFLPVICFAEMPNCKNVREGVFKMYELKGSLNTIIRTNEKQLETWGRTGLVVEYDIQWTSECSYLLLNPKKVKGNDSIFALLDSDTIFNEIVEVNNVWQKVVVSGDSTERKKEISYFNIDTNTVYKDLEDMDKLKDYKGAFGSGSIVGYNYFVKCAQHPVDTNKYLISFLEVLIFNDKTKYKLLDNVWCTLDADQKISTSNCRFNDQYDKEIVAVYATLKSNKEAIILMAWRCNKLTQKIESVNASNVKFKVTDKYLIDWE